MERKYQILIVDDAEINRSMLADILTDQYQILEAGDGREALSILEAKHAEISLVLLDIIMPEMNGFEVLSAMDENGWMDNVPVIMISAETSSTYIDRAYDMGAADYISRPFDEKTIRRRARNTIMLYAKQKMLEEMVTEQIVEKERNNSLMVEILSNIVEFRNGESGLHVLHIRKITELLLRHLAKMTDRYYLTDAKIALIVNVSPLHDIGKISIPEEILNKPGKLTPEEFEVMKTHSVIGARILENAPGRQKEELVQVAHDICRWHHERYDGGGYPDGLKGDDIPIAAQVVALADVYDALTNERIYKPAYPHDKAMEMIQNGECGAFSPLLLQCLAEVGPQILKEIGKSESGQSGAPQTYVMPTQLPGGGKASSRTLALLEQERTKFQFFASMSREILFEYSMDTELLTISDWGSHHLGLSELIAHPRYHKGLQTIFSANDFDDLYSRIKNASPEDPIVSAAYALNIDGQWRWHKVFARPLWTGTENPVMTGAIGKFTDIHEERMQLETFRQRATQDSLTGLSNHLSARELTEGVLAEGSAEKGALLLLDIDLFKAANDRHGHMFGDCVLKEVARLIAKSVRKGDIAARIGGDEFLIFTNYRSEAEPIVRRIYKAISGVYEGFEISVSMGVAVCPQDGKSYEQLFHRADQALYTAKKRGRRQYCFYDSTAESAISVLSPVESDMENQDGPVSPST
ncbi:bifunctional diguanylate cyclase/phosphohydrolase [Christensenella intestinihominis]|uniref:bifunctional diguanylate cyclase/phosphohydrolase n=1 Tax=Christensenella intestinihominis TaxID=1851429 RepID=UPI0009F5BF93|nr:diguanylate cyclase [Christensenella intestinihominis]